MIRWFRLHMLSRDLFDAIKGIDDNRWIEMEPSRRRRIRALVARINREGTYTPDDADVSRAP